MLQRLSWKLMPKRQRQFLLGRMPVVDRQLVNRVLSSRIAFPTAFARRNCLFIHVPKCAGSSICEALFDTGADGHIPLYWYEQQFPEQYARSFKFAFVRDPLERAYSAFAYLRVHGAARRDRQAQELMLRYHDFDDFVSRWLHPENLRRQIHFVPQTDFLTDSLGGIGVDFLGRHETLAQDYRALSTRLRVDLPLPHVNATRHRNAAPARSFCSEGTRRLVQRAYERDYELLGYA